MNLLLVALWKLGAVVAGALTGFLTSGFVVRKSTTALTRREAPQVVVFPFRVVGGALGGWLVMLAFGGGHGHRQKRPQSAAPTGMYHSRGEVKTRLTNRLDRVCNDPTSAAHRYAN